MTLKLLQNKRKKKISSIRNRGGNRKRSIGTGVPVAKQEWW
jgi:hypothetical protein